MSCNIRWGSVEKASFQMWTKELLYDSLNTGKRPHILSSEIRIKDLDFGEFPPFLEVLEIGDVANDRFRGIFNLKYEGDAQITLSTSIQANLLNVYEKNSQEWGGDFAMPKFPLSSQPFSIPLFVNLSNIRLSGIIVVVFSKSKGLTFIFKNDPLENIKVSSSFDKVQVIERFLQTKIENQIRDLFRDVLPSVLYKVSQKWTTSSIMNQLHSRVINDGDNKSNRLLISEINQTEPEISPANMLKLSTLNTSRQSLRLSIDPFPDVIERPNLYKYEQEIFRNPKKISIDILIPQKSEKNEYNYHKLDATLNQINKIQTKIYSNERAKNQTLKRRNIKMNKKNKNKKKMKEKKKKNEETIESQNQQSMNPSDTEETETTLVDSENLIILQQVEVNEPLKKSSIVEEESFKETKPTESKIKIPSPQPVIFEKFQKHSRLSPPLTPLKPEIITFYPNTSIHRANSPKKSQVSLFTGSGNVGLGLGWEIPPPPYH